VNSISFKSVVKTQLKAAKVHNFVNMRTMKADEVVRGLKRALSLGDRGSYLVGNLENCGYGQAKEYLIKTLPKLSIGFSFSKEECELLNSMGTSEAIALFDKFSADRARNMWHAFYRYNNDEAVYFLNSLSHSSSRSLKYALLGNNGLEEAHVPMISNILSISGKEGFTLPASLVNLGDPVIMKAVKELDLKTLSGFFVQHFIDKNRFEEEDQEVVKSVVRSLDVQKAIGFYEHLVNKGIIEASEALDTIWLNEEKTMDGQIVDMIKVSIQAAIIDSINNSMYSDTTDPD
jgi:hypothetical protein